MKGNMSKRYEKMSGFQTVLLLVPTEQRYFLMFVLTLEDISWITHAWMS